MGNCACFSSSLRTSTSPFDVLDHAGRSSSGAERAPISPLTPQGVCSTSGTFPDAPTPHLSTSSTIVTPTCPDPPLFLASGSDSSDAKLPHPHSRDLLAADWTPSQLCARSSTTQPVLGQTSGEMGRAASDDFLAAATDGPPAASASLATS
jgi:hypothetical protein